MRDIKFVMIKLKEIKKIEDIKGQTNNYNEKRKVMQHYHYKKLYQK